jgi:hypothetical protein
MMEVQQWDGNKKFHENTSSGTEDFCKEVGVTFDNTNLIFLIKLGKKATKDLVVTKLWHYIHPH